MPLVVCATPIGNLEDVTHRVLRALSEADVVLCEDTRRTKLLLDRYGLDSRLERFDAHVEQARMSSILSRLEAGDRVALVSDAGMPGISDPGARLIAASRARGLAVEVLPGPSAVETALVTSGLASGRYAFLGYLPRAEGGRKALWDELAGLSWPAVAFESPRRLPATLASLAHAEPDRAVVVCRELTKLYEDVVRGSAAELSVRFAQPPRGEITLVIAPAEETGTTAARTREAAAGAAAVAELVDLGVPRRAAARIAGKLVGIPANRLYDASL